MRGHRPWPRMARATGGLWPPWPRGGRAPGCPLRRARSGGTVGQAPRTPRPGRVATRGPRWPRLANAVDTVSGGGQGGARGVLAWVGRTGCASGSRTPSEEGVWSRTRRRGRHRGRTRGGPGAVSVGPARASRCAPTCGSPGQRPGGREARRVLPRKTPRPPAGGRGALKRAHGALQGLVHAWPRPLATHGHVVDTASGTGRVRLRGGGASAGAGGFYAVKPARSGWSWPRWPQPWPPWPRGGAAGVGHPPHHRARAGAGPGTEPVSGTGAGVCPGRSARGVHQRALRGQLAAVAARGARGGVDALGDLGVGDLGAGLQQLPHAFALLLR